MSRTRSTRDRGERRPRHRRDAPDLSFRCCNCRLLVGRPSFGSKHRNHCPSCLFSQHLDHRSGDRSADCGGKMEPIAIEVRRNGEWAIVHRCEACGELGNNRIASDDNEFVLMSLASRPMALPAFPLEPLTKEGSAPSESVGSDEDNQGEVE